MASDLPVELLEEIFFRLDDLAAIARASAACASFRSVVSNTRFLRRFRSLHGLHRRPVLGLLLDDRPYEKGLFCLAQSPWLRRSAAGSFAKAADFSFSFLPDRRPWRICDAREGRVLLTRCRGPHYTFEDLVVYDPLHRRHVRIPIIPSDLILSGSNDEVIAFDDPFLAPAADERDDDEAGFHVMCTALCPEPKVVVALIFSSASRQWRRVASFSNSIYAWTNIPKIWSRQYVHSCSCWTWTHEEANDMLVFDTREMKFSIACLPHKSDGLFKVAAEAGDGRLGLLLLRNHRRSATVDLYSKAWQGIEEPEEWQWQRDRSVPIRGFQLKMFAVVSEGYVLLCGTSIAEKKQEAHYFTMDLKANLKTLLVEKLCVFKDGSSVNFLYTSFPPPLSPPSV